MSNIARYYDLLSGKYDAATKGAFRWTPPLEAYRLLKSVSMPGHEVLDIGVGTGQASELLEKNGCKICAVDISSEMLKAAGKKFPSFELYQSNLEEGLPEIEGRTFDIVSAVGVLEFLKDINKSIATIKKFLKPSGYACFTIEEYISGHELQGTRMSETWKGSGMPKSELLDFFHHRQTSREVLEVIKNANLEVVSHHIFEKVLFRALTADIFD
jgi:ubiquinone/menaquinone biosynthesis C-methylase UbiE